MKSSLLFFALMVVAGVAVAISGCGSPGGPTPTAISAPPAPTSTPAARWLYADHNGRFFSYTLPLTTASKPQGTLQEWPGLGFAPQIAVDQFGNVALASPTSIRIFHPPIVSFAPSHAKLEITLTPAITEIGISGADLADIEYDANQNLWLFNNLGAGISELRAPLSHSSVAAITIGFGAPGSKTAGYTTLLQGRFDVNATLYVYATNSAQRSRLFKISFPYAKPPGSLGINLGEADFVDSSQWPPTARLQPSLLLGQYFGALASPHPGSPPSPPVDVLGQFSEPLNPQLGLFPAAHVNNIVGALVADPNRASFYTLDAADGRLDVYGLPLPTKAKPKLSLACLAGPSNCSQKIEHLFLAP